MRIYAKKGKQIAKRANCNVTDRKPDVSVHFSSDKNLVGQIIKSWNSCKIENILVIELFFSFEVHGKKTIILKKLSQKRVYLQGCHAWVGTEPQITETVALKSMNASNGNPMDRVVDRERQ